MQSDLRDLKTILERWWEEGVVVGGKKETDDKGNSQEAGRELLGPKRRAYKQGRAELKRQ